VGHADADRLRNQGDADDTHVPRASPIVRVAHMAVSTPTDIRRRLAARRAAEHVGDRLAELDAADTPADVATRPPLRFDRFYQAQYPSVVRLAYSLCGSMQIAEELAQEAFVSAHTRWRHVAGFDRPDLWVRRVVINRSISFRRREAIERKAVARIRPGSDDTSEPVVDDEIVWRAMRALSPRQAEVLALFYVEDQPLSAVAEILGLGPETVKTHLKRGRAALAAKLDAMGHVR
jgi:RNA polymerase sigma-70 factor, ECF subfamily